VLLLLPMLVDFFTGCVMHVALTLHRIGIYIFVFGINVIVLQLFLENY
jgi:hypothetical protein